MKIGTELQTELRRKQEHELALDKLKALAMKKWYLGDPLPIYYIDETNGINPMSVWSTAKVASLVILKTSRGYRIAKNRWSEIPQEMLASKDYAFFRTYTREEQ